ncbi:hypothetical protein ACJ41O_000490 [Fusarium nematophilum]
MGSSMRWLAVAALAAFSLLDKTSASDPPPQGPQPTAPAKVSVRQWEHIYRRQDGSSITETLAVTVAPDTVCGFYTPSTTYSFTCSSGTSCMWENDKYNLAFCGAEDFKTACYEQSEAMDPDKCDDDCRRNPNNQFCTLDLAPYCFTIYFPDGIEKYPCHSAQGFSSMIFPNGADSFPTSELNVVVFPAVTTESSSETTEESTTAEESSADTTAEPPSEPTNTSESDSQGDSKDDSNGDSNSDSSNSNDGSSKKKGGGSTNVGAIAGGVVGGVAVVALVILAVILIRRRDKKKALSSAQPSPPQPQMQQPYPPTTMTPQQQMPFQGYQQQQPQQQGGFQQQQGYPQHPGYPQTPSSYQPTPVSENSGLVEAPANPAPVYEMSGQPTDHKVDTR